MKQKNNIDTMNSVAVWWNEQDDVKVHLDVNIWHTKETKGNYLEFGIKIENYKKIDDIRIFVPYSITDKDIEDKVGILASDNALTNAMFNERLDISRGNGRFHTVKFPNDTTKNFLYCEIDIKKDVEIIDNKTIKLEINKNNDDNNIKTIYYRFRINKIEKIFTELKENYFWFDGFLKTIGFIEVNINSVRKLPKDIVDNLKNTKFNSINLFMMTDNFTNFIFQSEDINKSRILENHIWDQYLSAENNKNINKIIAYHWKKDDFKDYNLFVKISYITKSKWLIGLMLVLILSLGVIGGVGGNFVTIKYLNNFNDINITQEDVGIDSTPDIKKGKKDATK